MPDPTKKFVSVKKAATLTGKSEQKIGKLWEAYKNTKFVRRKDGKLYIRTDFLHLRFDLPSQEISAVPSQPVSTSLNELVQTQLVEKDKQLTGKDEQIMQLIERIREQNNIIFSLEQRQQQLESRLAVQLRESPDKPPSAQATPANYLLFTLAILLVGVVLIIFYSLLNG